MKNWRTLLASIVMVVGMFLPASQKIQDAIEAVGIVFLGLNAKDKNVTGGTTPQ